MSRWAQFVALGLGQLGGLQSLRDIVGNLRAQPHKLYHLGVRAFVSRSSLARVNAQQPYTLYEALFGRLLARCQQRAPRHGFRFKNKLYAVDASTIDLCLAAFPWASFRRTKGAIKLHVGVDLAGHLPTFISVTDGKTGDVTVARTWTFPAGSVVVADRAYLDFGWLHQLQQRGVTFVTRLKRNVRYQVVREHDVDIRTGVLSDQTIELTSARSRKAYPGTLRRVGYWDEETRRSYVFVTNNTTWVGKTIANLYKSRWKIELFFKWIKQHLKVKRFVGRTKNAVLSQLWVATCMYLLLAYLKFVLREKGPDVEPPLIAQQPIHLLHTMLGQRAHGLGQAAPHCMDCQRSARQHAQGGVGQRQHPFGMQVAFVQGSDEVQEVVSSEPLPG